MFLLFTCNKLIASSMWTASAIVTFLLVGSGRQYCTAQWQRSDRHGVPSGSFVACRVSAEPPRRRRATGVARPPRRTHTRSRPSQYASYISYIPTDSEVYLVAAFFSRREHVLHELKSITQLYFITSVGQISKSWIDSLTLDIVFPAEILIFESLV